MNTLILLWMVPLLRAAPTLDLRASQPYAQAGLGLALTTPLLDDLSIGARIQARAGLTGLPRLTLEFEPLPLRLLSREPEDAPALNSTWIGVASLGWPVRVGERLVVGPELRRGLVASYDDLGLSDPWVVDLRGVALFVGSAPGPGAWWEGALAPTMACNRLPHCNGLVELSLRLRRPTGLLLEGRLGPNSSFSVGYERAWGPRLKDPPPPTPPPRP